MTAILAYADAGKDGNMAESLLVADDLMAGQNIKADKIVLLGSRFAVGVIGNAALKECLQVLDVYCLPGNESPIDSTEALARNLREVAAKYLPPGYEKWKKDVEAGELEQHRLLTAENSLSTCVVLDCLKHTLWFINCGYLFPPERILPEFEVKQLDNGTLYGFSAASTNGKFYHDYNRGTGLPWDLIKVILARAQKQFPEKVGGVGASVECRGGSIKFCSCFKSPLDYVESLLHDNGSPKSASIHEPYGFPNGVASLKSNGIGPKFPRNL
jgi:hypothetical protein